MVELAQIDNLPRIDRLGAISARCVRELVRVLRGCGVGGVVRRVDAERTWFAKVVLKVDEDDRHSRGIDRQERIHALGFNHVHTLPDQTPSRRVFIG